MFWLEYFKEKKRLAIVREIYFYLYRIFIWFTSISVIFLTVIQILSYDISVKKFDLAMQEYHPETIRTERNLEYLNNGQYYYSSGALYVPGSNIDLNEELHEFRKTFKSYPWYRYDEKFGTWLTEQRVVANVQSWLESKVSNNQTKNNEPEKRGTSLEEATFWYMTIEIYKIFLITYFWCFSVLYIILRRNNIIGDVK